MQQFTLVSIFLVLASAVPSSLAEERDGLPVIYGYKSGDECPAKFFYDDCNRCFCGKDGRTAGCTLMACPPRDQPSPPELPTIYGYKYGEKCPATLFYDDCNVCKCGKDGHSAACTLMACPPIEETTTVDQDSEPPKIYGYKYGDKCPAKLFYDDCNICNCGKDGHSAACTLMAC